jgi:hypothetical protein
MFLYCTTWILAKRTIYQYNCHTLRNSTPPIRTQMELYLTRNNEDSDTYFFVKKKNHSQKSFPVVPDQAVA